MMVVENKYGFGDIVYVKTDIDQEPHIITGIDIKPGGALVYETFCGMRESYHYDFELTTEKNQILNI